MHAAQDERLDTLSRILCYTIPNPCAHRIAPVMRLVQVEGIEHRHDISRPQGDGICCRVMRFIAPTMPTGIYENELIVGFQRLDIAGYIPGLQTRSASMLQHQWRSFAFDGEVNTD